MKHKKGCFDMEEYWQRESTKILKQLEFAKNNVPFYKEKLKDIDIRNNAYSDLNRAEIVNETGSYGVTWFSVLQILMIVLPIIGITVAVIFIIRRKRKSK